VLVTALRGDPWNHLVDSFFENVPTHRFEKRELEEGEKETNTVLHFQPQSAEPMIVACLRSHWTGKDEPDLDSFSAITDEPLPEIAETGHERCIVSLQPENVQEWLIPDNVGRVRSEDILSDRQPAFYEHRKAAWLIWIELRGPSRATSFAETLCSFS
jgi:putative SOS response-associated peptidase YedK